MTALLLGLVKTSRARAQADTLIAICTSLTK